MTNVLNSGQWLRPGQNLKSSNGFHVFVMQDDGNLVLYSLGSPVWASGTDGHQVQGVVMQDDGNLVIYMPAGNPIWASNAHGRGISRLIMQDDRNAVTYDSNNSPTWSSGTHTDPKVWETSEIELSPELMSALKSDSNMAPVISGGLVCTTSPQGVVVCTGAMLAIAVILEFTNGKPPFGRNNDIRVIGRNINKEAIRAADKVSDFFKGIF